MYFKERGVQSLLFSLYPYHNFSDYNLDWCIKTVKELTPRVTELEEWRNEHEQEYNELKKLYDDIMAGRFPDSMIDSLKAWLSRNAFDIIGELVKMVFFGITDDGYFVAYIPESWNDITFNTTDLDIDISGIDYGHLVLSY